MRHVEAVVFHACVRTFRLYFRLLLERENGRLPSESRHKVFQGVAFFLVSFKQEGIHTVLVIIILHGFHPSLFDVIFGA